MQARQLARGQKVTNVEPEMALFLQCKEFNSLPNSGGLLDQDPYLLQCFNIISYEMAVVEQQKSPKRR